MTQTLPTPSLLETKLFAPKAKADLIPRPDLLAQLSKGLEVKLTLLSAPAGFGKTSLLSSWQASTGVALAWVSLDTEDNDLENFWLYLCAALSKLEPNLTQASLVVLRSPEPAPIKAVLTDVMNRLAAFSQQVVLVLDDYHVIQTPAIHESLGFLLEHLPTNVHLFVLSRADPPLLLAKLRARGEVVDIRAADLRFDKEDAARFFSQAFKLELNSHDLETLLGRTEGWVAGLRLAGLSLQGRDNPSNLIQAFAGSNRFILDYLAEEVLERQEPELQTFLLQTSILERLCAPLCDALTGGTNAQTLLERLEKTNLFLIPLDDERTWFRYHHLFADFLRTKLKQRHANEVTTLHHKAASWLEGCRLIEASLQHLFEAQNFEGAATLLEAHREAYLGRGTSNAIFHWLKQQSPATMQHHPLLCLYQANNLALGGKVEAAERFIGVAEYAAKAQPENLELQGSLAATRAFVMSFKGDLDLPAMMALVERARHALPDNRPMMQFFNVTSLVRAYIASGDLRSGLGAVIESRLVAEKAGFSVLALRARCFEARTNVALGQLQKAQQQYLETLRIASASGEHFQIERGLSLVGLGQIHYQQNELDKAISELEQGLESLNLWLNREDNTYATITLAQAYWFRGEREKVWTMLEAYQRTLESQGSVSLRWLEAAEALFHLWQGNLAAASRWVKEAKLELDTLPFLRIVDYWVLAKVLVAEGRLREALTLLEKLARDAERSGYVVMWLSFKTLESLVHQQRGDSERAVKELTKALEVAEPEGFIRPFADEGEALAPLLSWILKQRSNSKLPSIRFVRSLLAATEKVPSLDSSKANSEGLLEPLTERELEVLRLISEGLSNKDIARRLELAPSTVKWYVNELFGKLGVGSRTQAMARATALNLL